MTDELINETVARHVVEQHGFDWLYSHDTDSTNADVLRHHQRHRRDAVAVSEAQRTGRGRRGRQWVSPHARNIYCTIGLTRDLPAQGLGLLSIVTGLALCRALRASANAPVQLKWPNDLLFEGRKLGGILIESRELETERFFVAIGFGLNVHMNPQELAAIGQPATSLQQVADDDVDRTRVLGASIDAVIRSIQAFELAGVEDLISEFERFDAYHGQPIEVVTGDNRIHGINRGITGTGQLQLETERGIELHSAADISLRVTDP